ncbi:MAG TPA: hypothetical protein DD416_11825 [Rhodobacteraceae bacterium]|nr:hypothetical protein [Paracoccaceae bacterium]
MLTRRSHCLRRAPPLQQLDRPMQPQPKAAAQSAILSLDAVTKDFPGVRALSEVSLSLYPGKVTALIGENGAGKSTVVKILTGIYQPDGGKILVDGKPVHFANAQAAAAHGITAIHQETVLFDELSVAENIFLGHAPRNRFGLLDTAAMVAKAREILTEIEAPIDPSTRLRDLSIASKHLVAIARALSIDARVVIMDEPTAALAIKEVGKVLDLINTLKSHGVSVIIISHRMDDIFFACDRVMALYQGTNFAEAPLPQTNRNEVIGWIMGTKGHTEGFAHDKVN